MAKRRQRPKKKEKQDLLSPYTDPRAPGALGGLRRFARAQRLSQAQARDALNIRDSKKALCPMQLPCFFFQLSFKLGSSQGYTRPTFNCSFFLRFSATS